MPGSLRSRSPDPDRAVVWIVDDSPLDARRADATLADLGTCEVFVHGGDMLSGFDEKTWRRVAG